jgi:DNA-binding NarL/FixJ family response regulator
MMTAVEALQRHKSIFSARISDLLTEVYKRHRGDPSAAKVARLSPREREVVQLLGEGKTSKEVATMLGVTLKTLKTHRGNVMLKLKLHSIAELVLYAVRNEIIHVQLPAALRLPNPTGAASQRIN